MCKWPVQRLTRMIIQDLWSNLKKSDNIVGRFIKPWADSKCKHIKLSFKLSGPVLQYLFVPHSGRDLVIMAQRSLPIRWLLTFYCYQVNLRSVSIHSVCPNLWFYFVVLFLLPTDKRWHVKCYILLPICSGYFNVYFSFMCRQNNNYKLVFII